MNISIKGKVKFYSEDKGYGFIVDDKGTEYFFHISNVNLPDGVLPEKGDRVEFLNTKVSPRGYEAKGIEVIAKEGR